jgi:hypothetical protein
LEIYFSNFGTNLQLKHVCDFILKRGKATEQLIIIHIDETQVLGVMDGKVPEKSKKENEIFFQIIQCLWNARDDATSSTHLFPILSGTNALGLYKLFASSSYEYAALDLPLLKKSHMVQIAQSITSEKAKTKLEENSLLAEVMHIATEGHPRLQKAFVSVGSSQFETIQTISEEVRKQPFFRDGYSKLLEEQGNPEQVWKIVGKTSTEVERQFPEQEKIQSAG